MSVMSGRGGGLEPQRDRDGSLVHVIETLLDKGLVLNADIMVSVAGVELLGIRIRAALASFETAAKYGLEFPAGTDTETLAWRRAIEQKDTCPSCGKSSPTAQLLEEYCPWCGWRSARAQRAAEVEAADRPTVGAAPEDDGEEESGARRHGRGGEDRNGSRDEGSRNGGRAGAHDEGRNGSRAEGQNGSRSDARAGDRAEVPDRDA